MKKVLSPEMVAHTWANQTQSEARNPNGSLYFEGESIYSYGKHFCIAKHVINEIRERAILFSTRGYSNTTVRHKSIVMNACNHLNIIQCNDAGDYKAANIEAFENEIKFVLKGLLNARKPEKYIDLAESVYTRCEKFANFYGIDIPDSIKTPLNEAKNGKYANYLKAEQERILEEKRFHKKEAEKAHNKNVKKWKACKIVKLYSRFDQDYLRVLDGDIQTSQHVIIPKEVAKRIYNSLASGKPVKKILDYNVEEVTKDHIKVGCHLIKFKEINRIAAQMQWK